MEIIEVDNLKGLPVDTPLEMYEPPWMTEDKEKEVADLFQKKHGREPKEIYKYKHALFVR